VLIRSLYFVISESSPV